jgi:hypothetical protein
MDVSTWDSLAHAASLTIIQPRGSRAQLEVSIDPIGIIDLAPRQKVIVRGTRVCDDIDRA